MHVLNLTPERAYHCSPENINIIFKPTLIILDLVTSVVALQKIKQ